MFKISHIIHSHLIALKDVRKRGIRRMYCRIMTVINYNLRHKQFIFTYVRKETTFVMKPFKTY